MKQLFVETRRAQTSDRRQAQSVTQIGKSVFSLHVYALTKTVTDKQEHTVTGGHANTADILRPFPSSNSLCQVVLWRAEITAQSCESLLQKDDGVVLVC